MDPTQTTPSYNFDKVFYVQSDPNRRDGKGQTLLHEMCREGDLKALETLVSLAGNGLDFRAPDFEGRQPIHEAAAAGHDDMIIYLNAVRGVSIESETYDGKTPLYLAAANGRLSVVRRLLEFGARRNIKESRHGLTPLHAAARRGDVLVVGTLIAAGADLIACDDAGNTPHDLAWEAGYADTARLLRKMMLYQGQGGEAVV